MFLFDKTFIIRLYTNILDAINEDFDDDYICYLRYRKHSLDHTVISNDYQLYIKNIVYPPSSVKVDDKQAIFRPGMPIPLDLLLFAEIIDNNNYIKNNTIQQIEIITEDDDVYVFEDTNNEIKTIKTCSASYHMISFNKPLEFNNEKLLNSLIAHKKLKNITITFYEKAKDWYCLSFIDHVCYKNI